MATITVEVDRELWVIQDGDRLVLREPVIARAGNRSFTVPALITPPPFAILRPGDRLIVEIDHG